MSQKKSDTQHTRAVNVNASEPQRSESVATETVTPAIDICETDTGWLLVADMPGVSKDSIDVQVERGVLTISGRCSSPSPKGRLVYEGFQRVNYFRSIALSDEVDRSKITASQSDGVLTVVLPKAAAAQTRKITVQAGG